MQLPSLHAAASWALRVTPEAPGAPAPAVDTSHRAHPLGKEAPPPPTFPVTADPTYLRRGQAR